MSLKELALQEAVLKTLADTVAGQLKQVRATMQTALDAEEQRNGTRQIAITLPDGTSVGTVSLSGGTAEARISDTDAFTTWVAEMYPGEIERRFITEVRPAFADKLLAEMTAASAARVVDKTTGEVLDVPGVAIAPARARTHSVRLKGRKGADGAAAIEASWRSGTLAIPGVTGPAAFQPAEPGAREDDGNEAGESA